MDPELAGYPCVGSWVERWAQFAPDDTALVTDQRSFTFGEWAERIRLVAGGLHGLGVEPGDRIAWVGDNHPAFLDLLFATGLVGAVLAPVNHWLDAESIHYVLEQTEPGVVVYNDARQLSVPSQVRHRVAVGDIGEGEIGFGELADSQPLSYAVEVSPDDLFMIPHTSGTSGRPKGVMLSHRNVTWNAINMVVTAGLGNRDVTIAIAPFFRTGGTGVNVLPMLLAGGCVVVPATIEADTILRLVERHRATVGFANPDLLDVLRQAKAWDATDLSSLRFVITGGASVPERLIRAFLDRGIPVMQGYGLSEAAPVCMILDPRESLERIGSAGKAVFGVDVGVVDEGGTAVGSGVTGELTVRGPNVMSGYWRSPEKTREVLTDDGWLRTGDAGRMDDDGFFWVVGRMSDSFVYDGERVHPGDIERLLARHPDVTDAAVVGLPDPDRGEVGAAFVITRGQVTEDELSSWIEDHPPCRAISTIRIVSELPRSSVGKLDRVRLRQISASSTS